MNKCIISLACLAFSGLVFAGDNPKRDSTPKKDARAIQNADNLAKFDGNKNGKLDAAESRWMAKQSFAKWDVNGDGRLDAIELKEKTKTARQMPAGSRFGGTPLIARTGREAAEAIKAAQLQTQPK